MKNKLSLLVIFLIQSFLLHSQQKGNIVEYFGKEKIGTTAEGAIFHRFKHALVLREAIQPGILMGGNDIIAWQLAQNLFEPPFEGKQVEADFPHQPKLLQWETLQADSFGLFSGELSGYYVFMELDADKSSDVLLDASGHTRVFINGIPHEGDHYDYGYTLIPFKLQKGRNTFLFSSGRFARLSAKIVQPSKTVLFSKRDMTLAPLIRGEQAEKWSAIRVINNTDDFLKNYFISCTLFTGESTIIQMDQIMPSTCRKVKWLMPSPELWPDTDTLTAKLGLKNAEGYLIDEIEIVVKIQSDNKHHERTFISNIDGSVQYYSIAPSLKNTENQALVLSVHGASVEATNQTRAYKQKDWAHIVAPTNRRPFGFNWEEWGRIDALEVLQLAKDHLKTDISKTYLTGHSMGGHGSWFLGATYPDLFAAVAPAAAYPDIIGYRRGGSDSLIRVNPHYEMIDRGAMAGRVLKLKNNFLQSGIYVLHGDNDQVVPVEQARLMREQLGTFHNNFAYFEYPGGSHWYGDHSMDWPPLFDFLQQNKIPQIHEVEAIHFQTASPGVSAANYWISIKQQLVPYLISTANVRKKGDTITVTTDNVRQLLIDIPALSWNTQPHIIIEDQTFMPKKNQQLLLNWSNNNWQQLAASNPMHKHPQRYGGFKLAFEHHVIFVYATGGSLEEQQWYENKARFDAETFLYRGNFSIDIIPDSLFLANLYPDRNIILYGNADNNLAWDTLLHHCPIQVKTNTIVFGTTTLSGDDLGSYFIFPRSNSEFASIGVVAGTGIKGMKALMPNDYISGINGYPDLLIFKTDWLKDGLEAIEISGFFGHNWGIDQGEFKFFTE